MPFFFSVLLTFFLVMPLLAQPSPSPLPPHVYPFLKRAKQELHQGKSGPETARIQVLLKRHHARPLPVPTIASKTWPAPSSDPSTSLSAERRRLEQTLRGNPSDSETRHRLLEIAQLLGDQPEILRHQAVLKIDPNPLFWWGKLTLLVVILGLILQQVCALLHQLFGWNCPFSRSSP